MPPQPQQAADIWLRGPGMFAPIDQVLEAMS